MRLIFGSDFILSSKTKACTKCNTTKLNEAFYKEKKSPDGLRTSCKDCDHQRRVKRMTGMTLEQLTKHREERQAAYQKTKLTAQAYSAQYRKKNRAKTLIYLAKARAKKLGVPFDLDQHEAEIQARIDAGECEMSGIPFDLTGKRNHASPSLDRIVPSRGYVYQNIRVLCQAMNCALGNWGEEALREVMLSWMGRT